jgi:cell wall-associated NlpC family hydrolase
MTDRRLTPDPALVDQAEPATVAQPVADLLARPGGPRHRQLLWGEAVTVLGRVPGHALIRAEKDGYHGYISDAALGPPSRPTHRVAAPSTNVYTAPDLKSPDRLALSHGSRVVARGDAGEFVETSAGFLPKQHVAPVDRHDSDQVAVAQLYLGTPYLWGGNSRWGIDCSGLIQSALLTCGRECPGDSDLQHAAFPHIDPADLRRGDLVFWKGHVGMMLNGDDMIHANAHHMAVTIDPLAEVAARIKQKEAQDILGCGRP